MSTTGFVTNDECTPLRESVEAKQHRIAREAEELARARASVAAGRTVDAAEVKAWIDSIGTDRELPVPYSNS